MLSSIHAARPETPTPAIFLDRDGTMNVDKAYVYRISDWQWIAGADRAIALLKNAGFLVVVISNQAGIARGYYCSDDVHALHAYVMADLKSKGTQIDAFYFCPHHPHYSGPCDCRKPHPKMIAEAAVALNIDLKRSWIVGDKVIDMLAGQAAGVASVLVRTGYGRSEQDQSGEGQLVADNLLAAARLILK
jgi:D-glycero-D-manno-heptose 1,7-bisphosphate phosphatase